MDSNKTFTDNFGTVKYGTITESRFNISEFKDRLHYIGIGCGCSSHDVIGDEVIFRVDTTKVGAEQGTFLALNKVNTIFLDPDVPEFIVGEKYKRIPNPQKERFQFSLVGGVE
jgi:hypothetical protein